MIKMTVLEYVIHLTLNLPIYHKPILRILLQLVLLKINKTLKISKLLMPPMKISKFELKLHTVDKTNEFNVSGSGLLLETTSLLVGKRYNFNRSNPEKYFIKSFCASTKGTSFLLLHPKGAIFTSCFWLTMNYNYSIEGSIKSPLL